MKANARYFGTGLSQAFLVALTIGLYAEYRDAPRLVLATAWVAIPVGYLPWLLASKGRGPAFRYLSGAGAAVAGGAGLVGFIAAWLWFWS